MKRISIDLCEDMPGSIGGKMHFPADSLFVFECLALVIEEFSKNCEVPPEQIVEDLKCYIRTSNFQKP